MSSPVSLPPCPTCGSTSEDHEHLPLVPIAGHPIVVAVFPGIPVRLVDAALEHAKAFGSSLVMAYVDESRVPVGDGSASTPLIPDDERTPFQVREADLRGALSAVMARHPEVPWEFRYLAGLTDRELAHLAHSVDAGAFIVGTKAPGFRWQAKEWFDGSVAVQLSRRQRRPVIIVPLRGEDWSAVLHAPAPGETATGMSGDGSPSSTDAADLTHE